MYEAGYVTRDALFMLIFKINDFSFVMGVGRCNVVTCGNGAPKSGLFFFSFDKSVYSFVDCHGDTFRYIQDTL